jgi:hypothetical protein
MLVGEEDVGDFDVREAFKELKNDFRVSGINKERVVFALSKDEIGVVLFEMEERDRDNFHDEGFFEKV